MNIVIIAKIIPNIISIIQCIVKYTTEIITNIIKKHFRLSPGDLEIADETANEIIAAIKNEEY